MKNRIITISREFGSGGRTIGKAHQIRDHHAAVLTDAHGTGRCRSFP